MPTSAYTAPAANPAIRAWMASSTTSPPSSYRGTKTAGVLGVLKDARDAERTPPASTCSARDRGLQLQLVELGRILPKDLLALVVCQPFLDLVGGAHVPVRVARPVHEHVLLSGQARPLPDHLLLDGGRAVELPVDEKHVAWQVGRGNLRRPRRLLEVWAAERVHAPDERREQVTAPVSPNELQVRKGLEHALGDHVHQVVEVVERHERDVLRIGPGVT